MSNATSEPSAARETLADIIRKYRVNCNCTDLTFEAMIQEWAALHGAHSPVLEWQQEPRPAEGGLYTPYPPDALQSPPDEALQADIREVMEWSRAVLADAPEPLPMPCLACEGSGLGPVKVGLWGLRCRTCGGSGIQP